MDNKNYTKEDIEKMSPKQIKELKQTKIELTYHEFTDILEEIFHLGFKSAQKPIEAVLEKVTKDLKPNYDIIAKYLVKKDDEFSKRRDGKGGKIITHTFLESDNK